MMLRLLFRNLVWTTLVWMAGAIHTYAFQSEYTASRFLSELSFHNTIDMAQDAHGFIWFGTLDGLNRYDGNEVRVYKHKPFDSTSLVEDFVGVITPEINGKIWMGTAEGGLCIYDRRSDNFKQIFKNDKIKNTIRDNRIRVITSGDHGTVYVGHALGVDILDSNGICVNVVPLPEISLRKKLINAICVDKNRVFIASESGLYAYDPIRHEVTQIMLPTGGEKEQPAVMQIVSYGRKNEWLVTTYETMYRFSADHSTWTKVPVHLKNGAPLKRIKQLKVDENRRWWLGSFVQGLCLVDSNFRVIDEWSMNGNEEHQLKSNRVQGVLIDRDKNVWVSTSGGVHKLIRPFDGIRNVSLYSQGDTNRTPQAVRAFSRYHDQRILLGTNGGGEKNFGLYWYEASGRIVPIKPSILSADISLPILVLSISEEKNGIFWIGTTGQGLLTYDPKNNTIARPSLKDKSINHLTIYSVLIDQAGNQWLGTNGEGVYRIHATTREIKKFSEIPDDSSSLSGHIVRQVYQDYDGRIWVSSFDGGLNLFINDSSGFRHFKHDPLNQSSISSNLVLCATHDTINQVLWIGTRSGLNVLDLNTFLMRSFFTTDGLSNNIALGALIYENDVWVSSYMGLTKYSQSQQTFTIFSRDDGIMSETFTSGAFYNAGNGHLFFGGTDYFLIVDAKKQFTKFSASSGLFINKISKIAGASETGEINTKAIELWPNDIGFTVEYALVNHTSSKRNRYSYMLEGFNENWISNGSATQVTFTNLDPGDYRLIIRGEENGIGQNESKASIQITVHPPYWKTWWFRLACVLAITLMFRYLYRVRIERLLSLQKLRTQIASDLHDDIGSTLTKIALHADLALTREEMLQRFELISQIGYMSRSVIGSMSHIVWSIDARHDNLGDLIDHMHDHIYSLSASGDITFRFFSFIESPNAIPIKPDFRQNTYLIFKEAINNVIKHAQASDVSVALHREAHTFSMRIADNGRGGLDLESKSGHGVQNMQRRAHAIKGQLTITSEPGKTEVILQAPLDFPRFINLLKW